MDSQDQRKSIPSGHESQGVHLCHKCGWPFPNPHPSAKHRRAHKRICGTIEGYKLIDSEEHSHLVISDDEHGSDEDRRTPSLKIVKSSTNEISGGGVSARSNRSEDEVFTDPVAEFSDNGFSLVNEGQLKVDASAGMQLPNFSKEMDSSHNNTVLETETNLPGSATPVVDFLSTCKSDSMADLPKEGGKVYVDNEMQSSSLFLEQGTEVKGNEESSAAEILSDVAVTPHKTAGEASEVACNLQEKDLKTSDSLSADQIVEAKQEQIFELGSTMSLHDLSPEVKSCDHVEVLVNTAQNELYSAKNGDDIGSHSDAVKACYIEGEGNENFHVLSVANDLPAVDNPDIMIQDFKDHKTWKSNLPVTLETCAVIEPAVDDYKDTVCEEKSTTFPSGKSGESSPHIPSAELHVLEGNLKQEDEDKRVLATEVPVEKEAGTSELKVGSKDVGSNGVEATPETTTDSVQDVLPEPSTISDVIPVAISADDEVSNETNLSGGNNECTIDNDKNGKCDRDGKESEEVAKEELSTNIEATRVSVDDLSVSEADQTIEELRGGNSDCHKTSGIEFPDLVGNGSRDGAVQDKPEMNSKMIIESAPTPSDSEIVVDEVHEVMKKLQEGEITTSSLLDSNEVGPHLQNYRGEDSQEAMKEPKSNSTNAVLVESVGAACKGVESYPDSVAEVSEKTVEIPPEVFPMESDSTMKCSATVDGSSHCKDGGLGAAGVSNENLEREDRENLTKPPEVPAVDVSIDSSSQTDSLDGNWGSVSVLSTQSDAVAAIDAGALPSKVSEASAELEKANLQKPQPTLGGHDSSKSDVFDAPSFMTLVEHQDRNDQKVAVSDTKTMGNAQQQAGWFPSLTNIGNESQGRKKNEEIIAKVTNWSTGKQHTPLKSLLGEANLETQPKSPNPKQTPSVTKKDENSPTVNSLLGSEAPTDQVAKREMEKEWNSPARYPSDNKKEKRKVKGKPYWVPFLCCSSIN